mmetsp:Transcript_123512/g.395065  ORF Transcript_123512/g.395065 Transcript_123512/m.395065 type:complete len:88 (+) Transcript_123512:757-1020(+)
MTYGTTKNIAPLKAVEHAGRHHMEICPTFLVQMKAAARKKPEMGAAAKPEAEVTPPSALPNKNWGLDISTLTFHSRTRAPELPPPPR